MADEKPPQISIAWPQQFSPPPDLANALWSVLEQLLGVAPQTPAPLPVNPVNAQPVPAPVSAGGGDLDAIASAFLGQLGLIDDETRHGMVSAWVRCEKPAGEPGQWNNPMNTTLRTAHSTGAANDLGGGIGVQIYDTLDAGIAANVSTLLEPQFSPILSALAEGDSVAFANAFDHRPVWGTSSSCVRSLL